MSLIVRAAKMTDKYLIILIEKNLSTTRAGKISPQANLCLCQPGINPPHSVHAFELRIYLIITTLNFIL